MAKLGPEAGHIFRITHVRNLPWILEHGLHCANSSTVDPNFVPIGLPDLIRKRAAWPVPVPPHGFLSDYVPFYFTPWSIMMCNITTGFNGVIKRPNREIAIIVSRVFRLADYGVPFVFTNGHARLKETEFFSNTSDLGRIDWKLLINKDFQKDPEDPGKLGRYQAECLAFRHVPAQALLGIVCYDQQNATQVAGEVERRGLDLSVKVIKDWYF
ncbi:MAG: DUF4433 domain-containing protein [Planctomycetaceae bacterium]|nr:DUF4433 domain-containing protein [Planctomycetaceae bacterium]